MGFAGRLLAHYKSFIVRLVARFTHLRSRLLQLSLLLNSSNPFVPMLATARIRDPTMWGLEQEPQDTFAQAQDSDRDMHEGFLNLTRRMENEEEDQFDVDLTILDFLVYKATGLVFEWISSSDPYHSDLPNALVSMTAGVANQVPMVPKTADMRQIGGPFSSINIMGGV